MSEIFEKVNIELPDVKTVKFDFKVKSGEEVEIKVRPYLTMTDKEILIREYVDILYDPSSNDIVHKYIIAENTLIFHIIDICTNINIGNGKDEKLLDVNLAIENNLWNEIRQRIPKFDGFRNNLDSVLKAMDTQNALDQSVGHILDGLSIKLMDVLNKIPDFDVKELKASTDKIVGELESMNKQVPGITKTLVRGKRKGRPKKVV